MSHTLRAGFSRQPMLLIALCFAAGIVAADLFKPVGIVPAVIATGVLAALAFVFRSHRYATVLVALAFVLAGAVSYTAEAARRDAPGRLRNLYDSGEIASGTPVEVEGTLAAAPERSFDGYFLTMRAIGLRANARSYTVSGNVRLFVPDARESVSDNAAARSGISDLRYGSRIRVACGLTREERFQDPGVRPTRESLDRQDIDAVAAVRSPLLIEHIADESVFIPMAWVYDARSHLIEAFRANLAPQTAGVMIASLLGDKYFLDKDTAELFRTGGTFHILVISGLHITFIGGLLLLVIRQFTRNRWLQFLITTLLVWVYTLAVGADVPVVRAAIMFTTLLLSYAIYRQSDLLNSLGLCAVILLVWRPSDLLDASFQLTFVSVGSIVAIAYPLLEHLRKIGQWTPTPAAPFPPNVPNWLRRSCETLYWNEAAWPIEAKRNIWTANIVKSPYLGGRIAGSPQRWLRYVIDGLIVSLIVQICMLPLSVIYFHRVPFASVLLNLWVGVFIAIESGLAMFAAALSFVSFTVASTMFTMADAANWLMLSLPRLLSFADWTSTRIPAYSGNGRLIYALYFVPLIAVAVLIDHWEPFELKALRIPFRLAFTPVAVVILLALLVILHPFSEPGPDGRLHVDFLDVGQGDSALVTFPNGETMLIDGGGQVDYRKSADGGDTFVPDRQTIGESVVSQVLWSKGYSHIDHVLATHADADHIQGLGDVVKNFQVDSALLGRMPMEDPEMIEFVNVLQRHKVPVEIVSRGNILKFGGVAVEVLYPLWSGDGNAPSDNNNSVVLRIAYGSRALLLTGDIEQKAESDLLTGGTLRSDVVKVAHHGSRTSSTQAFINATAARYAIISVGRHSPFGHPNREVLDRWLSSGAIVATTGENGMISFSTNGTDIVITRFAQ